MPNEPAPTTVTRRGCWPGWADGGTLSPAADRSAAEGRYLAAMTHAIVLVKAAHEALPDARRARSPTWTAWPRPTRSPASGTSWPSCAWPSQEQLAEVVAAGLRRLPAIERTQTMVAFEVFSKHDLEAMFSIGE